MAESARLFPSALPILDDNAIPLALQSVIEIHDAKGKLVTDAANAITVRIGSGKNGEIQYPQSML